MAEAPVQEIAALKIDSNGSAKVADAPASPAPAEGAANLKEQFKAFSKFGDVKSDGKLITLSQSDKWMKQAGVIDKKITTTDTGIHFKKLKLVKVSYADYNKFLEDLAKTKSIELSDIKAKLAGCGSPGANSAVKSNSKAAETVARLTDPSRYTGSSKERFDAEGKGRGIAGRRETSGDGYVSGYQNKNSFDKTH